jgi:hypothetical protein
VVAHGLHFSYDVLMQMTFIELMDVWYEPAFRMAGLRITEKKDWKE